MPLFSDEAVAKLARQGISHEEAETDVSSAAEVPDIDETGVIRLIGRLGMYTCRARRVFGRVDLLVEDVWFK